MSRPSPSVDSTCSLMADVGKKKNKLCTSSTVSGCTPLKTSPSQLPNGLSTDRLERHLNSSMRQEQKKYAIPSVTVNLGITGTNAAVGTVIPDLRQRGITDGYCKDHHVSGIITPFRKPHFTIISKCFRELQHIFHEKRAKRILAIIVFVIFCMTCFFTLCKDSNSTALTAYTYISVLDLSLLLTCLLSVWVEQQRPTPTFTFGYGRVEVLAIFACTVLAILGALVLFKDCMEQLFHHDKNPVDGGKMLVGCGGILVYRLIVIHCTDSKAWNHVFISSKSSWLQRQVTEICENFCQLFPGLSRFLLPRINPFVLMAHMDAVTLFVAQFLIQLKGYYTADTVAGLFIACLLWTTVFPMFTYVGLILLQTTPAHVVTHLDKCLREAATVDGVLEFRNEHFWTLSFGVLAGSVHVRVRRDANEQLVLAHLTNRLSTLVPVLTIQVVKDDWSRGTSLQLLNEGTRKTTFSHQAPVYGVGLPLNQQQVNTRAATLSSASQLPSSSSSTATTINFQESYAIRKTSELPVTQVSTTIPDTFH